MPDDLYQSSIWAVVTAAVIFTCPLHISGQSGWESRQKAFCEWRPEKKAAACRRRRLPLPLPNRNELANFNWSLIMRRPFVPATFTAAAAVLLHTVFSVLPSQSSAVCLCLSADWHRLICFHGCIQPDSLFSTLTCQFITSQLIVSFAFYTHIDTLFTF